ncbi:MAG TPA: hypothetical protein VG055_12050 [Planctomycetaceae bacterium]|nr:hypothetical protein [Planctomycetaceae bacterium]
MSRRIVKGGAAVLLHLLCLGAIYGIGVYHGSRMDVEKSQKAYDKGYREGASDVWTIEPPKRPRDINSLFPQSERTG